MDERAFYNETTTSKAAELNCPHCHTVASYDLQWVMRRKKASIPAHADERDKARFAKAQSYMVLTEDKVMCSNTQCRKRFEVSGIKTMAFLSAEQEAELTSRPERKEPQQDQPRQQRQPRQGQQRQKKQQQQQRAKGGGQQKRRGAQQPQGKKRKGQQRGNRDEQRGNRDENRGNRDDNWGNREEYWGNRADHPMNEPAQRGGNRWGKSGPQQGQKKGKKKRPQVYFPSDYVNYRP